MNGNCPIVWCRGSPQIARVIICTATLGIAANLVRAEELRCPASTAQQARALADQLLQADQYEGAGKCYEVAGEYARANRAFLDAVGSESKATARQLSDQRNTATKLARQLQRAFHGPP
jgi:hypothetical protein